ncbi:MAG: electron transfer flavoprotein subunit beta/FixA family protein [Anaerolineaceae bacterium]|nr:electron transfer flavoprotein subunit beta/FixA family protein [Anaerolineaceae bacterium]MCB9097908.1 electron transfer flavoprotein subunit beta/FixA family protein [Anaerolineales bacterium]
MKIIVLIKQVPDTAQLSANMNGLQLMASGPRIINPWDEYAIEEGLKLREAHGGSVTLLCLGTPDAVETLKRGLAMGADEAVLISDPQLAGGDSLATARALAAAIEKIGAYDLVIAGRSSIDGGNFATAVQVAALLAAAQLSYVAAIKAIDPAAKTITVERLMEAGRETVSSKLPAVMTVVKEINEPRYPSFMQIRKAAKKDVPVWSVADLGLDAGQVGAAGSQVKWSQIDLPPTREAQVEILEGTAEESAKALVDRLLAEKII